MFKEGPLDEPESDQDQPVGLSDIEGPGHSVHVVKELVRQWRVHRLVRHPLVDNGDDDGGEDEVEQGIKESHASLPPLLREAVCPLLRHSDFDVVTVSPQSIAQRVDQLVLFQQAAQFAFAVVGVRGGRRHGGVPCWVTVGNPLRHTGIPTGHVNFHVGTFIILDQF